nr:MAG TPA: PHAGOCYTE NADPH OXIDASE SUBUNIT P67PHOX/PHAGOCYTE, P47PHOX, SH3-PEPTIDE COMPLEX, HELIX-TURN-HELIX [Caudoviricetes sp.]
MQRLSTPRPQALRIFHRCSPMRRIITMRRFLFDYHVLIIVIRYVQY